MAVVEGALVIAALLIAGALAGYLWHERIVSQRQEVFVDFPTMRAFLEKRHGITLSREEWNTMAQAPGQAPNGNSATMLKP